MSKEQLSQKGAEAVSKKIAYETTEDTHREKVVMFKNKTTKLESLLSALPAEYTQKTTTILNALLKEKGFGGVNSGPESFAYFIETQDGPLLVFNTIANGEKNTKLGDIDVLLEKIRVALEEWKVLDRSNPTAIRIHKYSHLTSIYEANLTSIDRNYQKNASDLSRLKDTLLSPINNNTDKKISERANRQMRDKVLASYHEFLKEFGAHPPKNDKEMHSFVCINARFQQLLKHRFDEGISKTQDIAEFLWDHKGEMAQDGFYGAVGELKWLAMSIAGIVLVIGALGLGAVSAIEWGINLATDKKAREKFSKETWPNFMKSLKKATAFIIAKSSHPGETLKELEEWLRKKFYELGKLPHEKQAEAIGYFAGEIIGLLEGWLLTKWALKAGMLRIKFGVEIADRIPIGKVTNWMEMEKFVNTIDRLRFRSGWDSARLLKTIEEVRLGNMKLRDIPDVWGIRTKVAELLEHGGKIPEKAGILEKVATKTEITSQAHSMVVRGMESSRKAMSVFFEHGFNGKVAKAYDGFDKAVTTVIEIVASGKGKLLAPLEMVSEKLKEPATAMRKSAHEAYLVAQEKLSILKEHVSAINFPKKAECLKMIKEMEAQMETIKWVIGNIQESLSKVDKNGYIKVTAEKLPKKLSKSEIQDMKFIDGIGKREVMENGVLKQELYRSSGLPIIKERFDEVLDVRNGMAFVKRGDGIGIIHVNGTWEVPIQKWVFQIQSMKHAGATGYMLAVKNSEGRIAFHFSPDGILSSNSREYSFFANLDRWMGMGTYTDINSGKMVKVLLNSEQKEGGAIILRLPEKLQNNPKYMEQFGGIGVHVDLFTKEWYAAVRLPDGRWTIMDRNGKYIWENTKTQSGLVTKNSELEALQEFYKSRGEGVYKGASNSLEDKASLIVRAKDMVGHAIKEQGGIENIRHTGIKQFYEFTSKEGKLGFLNMETGKVVTTDFSHIQFMDAQNGFLRFEKNGKWGIMDISGNVTMDAKHGIVNLLDENKKIFEVGEWVSGGGTKVGVVDANGKELLAKWYDYIETIEPGLYRGIKYTPGTYNRLEGGNKDVLDIRRAAITSVQSRGDKIADALLAGQAAGDVRKTGPIESYTNDKIRVFYDGSVSEILATFSFKQWGEKFESMIHPFNATKVFKTIGRLLGKEIGEELTSKRGVKELAKILTLRSAEITEKFREQAKRLSKVSKDFSYQMMLEWIK